MTTPRLPCGWPVQRPASSTTWWCNREFGHDEPHSLLDARGHVVASAIGYRHHHNHRERP